MSLLYLPEVRQPIKKFLLLPGTAFSPVEMAKLLYLSPDDGPNQKLAQPYQACGIIADILGTANRLLGQRGGAHYGGVITQLCLDNFEAISK